MLRRAGITAGGLLATTVLSLLPAGSTPSATAATMPAVGQAARSVADTRDGTGTPLNPCFSHDNGDPQLLGLSMQRDHVDVRRHAGTLTFTARVVDRGGPGPASGVRSVHVRFAQHLGRTIAGVHLEHTAGNRWRGSIRVPRFVDSVSDRVAWVRVADRAGNVRILHRPVLFSVVSTPDVQPPALTRVGFVRRTVLDTSTRARRVTVTATAVDTGGSGVARVTVGLVPRTSPNLGGPVEAVLRPTSGNRLSGTARIPAWVGSTTWRLGYAGVVDRAGNDRQYDDDLATLGMRQALRVTSRRETSVPRVGSVRGMPRALDVRGQRRSFTIRVRARDAGSGVRGVTAQLWQLNTDGFESSHVGAEVPLRLTRGSRRTGEWTARMSVPRCSFAASGRLVLHLAATDRARNALLRTTVRTTALTTRTKTRPVASARSLRQPFGPPVLTFAQAVSGITRSSARPVQVLDGRLRVLRGTWRCRTVSGRVTSCRTGYVRTATFHARGVPGEYDQAYVELNPAGRLDVRDRRGTPYDRTVLYYS